MLKSLLGNILVQAASALTPALALALFYHSAQLDSVGALLSCQASIAAVVGFSDLGTSVLGMKSVSFFYHRGKMTRISNVIGAFQSYRITSLVFFCSVQFLYLFAIAKVGTLLTLLAVITALLQSMTLSWAVSATELNLKLFPYVLISRLIWLFFVAVSVDDDVGYLFFLTVLNGVLFVATNTFFLKSVGIRSSRVFFLDPKQYWKRIKKNRAFGMSRLAVNFYQTAPMLLLGSLSAPVSVAIYGAVELVHKLFLTATYPISESLFARGSGGAKLNGMAKWMLVCWIATVLAVLVFAIFPSIPIMLIGGHKLVHSAHYLPYFLLVTGISVTSIYLGFPLLGLISKIETVNRSTYYSPLIFVTVFLTGFFSGIDSILGAILGLLAAESVVFVIRLKEVISNRTLLIQRLLI